MNDQLVKIPETPMSLKQALEEYADLVYDGKVNVELLAALEFDDTLLDPPEAFRLLSDYENLPTGQRLILNKIIISDGIQVFPADIWSAYSLQSSLSYSELITKFEHINREADIQSSCLLALAIRFKASSEHSLKDICRTVKRTVHYRHAKDRSLFGKKAKKTADEKLSIQSIQDFLEQNEGNSKLLSLYEREYGNVEYQPALDDNKSRVIAKPEELSIAKVDQLLNNGQDNYDYHQVFSWLFTRAIGNETFRESIRRSNYFSKIINHLRSPMDFADVALFLDANNESIQSNGDALDLYDDIVARILAALRKSCHHPDAVLQFARHFCDRLDSTLLDEMKKLVAKSLDSLAPGKIIEGLGKMNAVELLIVTSSIPEATAHRLMEYLSAEHFLHTQPKIRLIAAFLHGNKDLWLFDRYLNLLSADRPGLSTPERRRLKDLIKVALALAGMKEQIPVLESAVESAIERIEKTHAEKARAIASGTSARIREIRPEGGEAGADHDPNGSNDRSDRKPGHSHKHDHPPEPPPKRPGQLDAIEFTATIKDKLAKLNLDPALAANIGVTKTPTGPIPSKIRADLEATAAAAVAIELFTWNDGEEKVIEVEENSILSRLGIKALRFRKTKSFDVEFLFAGDEPAPFYGGVHLNDQGVPSSENFRAEQLLKAILELEAIRHFVRIMMAGEEVQDAGNLDVLRLLGLEAMPAPEPDPQPNPPDDPKNPPDNPKPKNETHNFILENWQAFEEFMEHLENTGDVKMPFKHLHALASSLAAKIQMDKAIPNFGVTVEMPFGHMLSPHVQSLDFYDPTNTREILRKLEINPAVIHVDSLDKLDAYLVRINVRIAGADEQISACIIPPTNRVYFFGVDPDEIIDNERSEPLALTHMILQAFKMAVMRDDDPEVTHAGSHPGGSKRRGAIHINRIITEATRTSYPPIVTSWKTKPGRQDSSGIKQGRFPTENLQEYTRDILEKIAVADTLETGLISAGVRMRAAELWRLLPQSKEIPRHKFPDIYMPIDNPEVVEKLLQIYREQKLVGIPEEQDWFLNFIHREGVSEADAFAALDFITGRVKNPGAPAWEVNPYFRVRCAKNYRGPNPYGQFLSQVLAICQNDHAIGPQTSLAEVYQALRGASILDPENVKIATSGAADFRFPYRFREGGKEMPAKKLFKDGYEVQGNIDLEVVKIIAGNRARMSAVSEIWLRGDNRGEDMNFASRIQSRMSDKTAEVDLRPRARALLVWEFLNDEGEEQYAFSFLDSARDSLDSENPGSVIPAAQRLQRFPKIQTVSNRVLIENATGNHTDFDNPGRWSKSELVSMEMQGIFTLERDGSRIIGIQPGSIKRIQRKKILILTDEQVGYRQFRFKPATFADYMEFAHKENLLDASFGYNPRLAKIQKVIYELLEPV